MRKKSSYVIIERTKSELIVKVLICQKRGVRVMDQEKRSRYAEILLNAYQNDIFKIVWSTSGFSMAIDSKKKDMLPELKEEEFIEYAFSIIKMVIDLAEDRVANEKYEGDLKIAQAIFEKEHDLKNHLYIKRNSKMDCFKLLEYEIISHRNKENPANIEATSAIIKMMIEKEDNETVYAFETSRRDLEDMINKLIELKEKVDTIV